MPTATPQVHRRRQRLAILAVSAIAGALAAGLTTGVLNLFPPGLKTTDLHVAVASRHVFVDTAEPSVLHRGAYPVSGLIRHAELLGQVMIGDPLVERTAARAHVPADRIGAGARVTADVQAALTEPGDEQRANDIWRAAQPYQLQVQSRQTGPVLDIYTVAPSEGEARRLVDASVAELGRYLTESADAEGLAAKYRVRLRPMGPARGASLDGGMPQAIGVVSFALFSGLVYAGLTLLLKRRRGRPQRRHVRRELRSDDDWPHTTRLMPWSFAAFLAVLWLIPFNDIELTVQMPIDLKFDRLVLPFVAAAWALALMVGGRVAPRLRWTWIHTAVATFVVVAFISVIFNARELTRTLELEGAVKALPLLVAYVSVFVIASTAVRPTEVRAFLQYTLVLAVLCALGIIWEYRLKQNLFYTWSDLALPGIFSVESLDAGAIDDIGRRLVRGPAALPLEAVAMLALALPIALVSLIQAHQWRHRILYGLAACILLAAAFATFRKSALLAPVSVIATVAYFRRRELLRLSPLALVLIVLVHVLAPGALGKTGMQFDPSRLGVTTVSDRASDYDAVRPDVWTHFLFGRGWGSYDHVTYRTLDSEFLHRGIEMGMFGLLAYVFMPLAVIIGARRLIADRHPEWSPPALMGAAAAVVLPRRLHALRRDGVPARDVHLPLHGGAGGGGRATARGPRELLGACAGAAARLPPPCGTRPVRPEERRGRGR